ncbi:hypothetical protein J5069_14245 [Candidatus Symbiopectobacterium sp. NZEC127]|uniref:serine/threonine-protein kinase n=1 Tax=Candidatus Symbiopectobacterium sp. NZEC127 TaxID=2820472 RepID=UPI002225D677|nr:serine/threonine-protein kinase [Candidatus Symbiopectobacterium sp. NZEC127]MCW2487052.1 hypothetical protein [Candidatus Symbiopectobacterium sp. NZEC127]
MPVSALQYRLSTECYHDKSCNKKSEKALKSINSNSSVNVQGFSSQINHVENSPRIFNTSSTFLPARKSAIATTVQLMLLLNFLHRSDAASFAYKENPLSNLDNDLTLANRSDSFDNYPISMSLVDDGHVSQSPLLLPEVKREVTYYDNSNGTLFINENSHILSDDEKKDALISAIKHYLVSDGQLTAEQGQDFELSLKQWAKAGPLFITPLAESTDRVKRALMPEYDPRTAEHIKEHCAFEEEILNAKGENEGKLLLFQAQRAENPFRMIYDDTEGGPRPEARGAAEGLNIVTDILTLGIKPLIGKLIANAKRREYYKNQGDEICAERFRRLTIAEIATSLDVDGIAFKFRGVARKVKPTELLHTTPGQKRAAYYVQNPRSGIKKEILLELKPGNTAIHTEGGEIFLKPTDNPNEFMTYHPYATRPELLQRKVIVDEETLAWRYADTFDAANLNVEVREGKKQIPLYGEYYDLNKNGEGKFEIVVRKASGSHEFVPVYLEPLSNTWHMRTHNQHPVFTHEQENIINTLRIEPDRGFNYIPCTNNNPRYYGSGKIYRAEKIDDTSHYPWGRYIEMNGEVVPVREVVSPGRGVHYEVYNSHYPDKEHYLVSWDGGRWVFERPTSIHVSSTLEKQITSDMFTNNIDVTQLSSPDKNGLRWDENNKSYLNVNNQFIHVKKMGNNRFLLMKPVHGPKTVLRLKNNKFYQENLAERLENIMTVGLGGRKRKTALSVLKEVDGFTEASAEKLLSEYRFQEKGLFNDYAFALEIEQTGTIPPWAKRLKKDAPLEPGTSKIMDTITLMKPDFPVHKVDFHVGKLIGEGTNGEVFIDADDNAYLIKVYLADEGESIAEIAKHEAEVFRRYYGEDAAMHLVDDEGVSYVRMYKIPGETLSSLPPGSLPNNAEEKFVDMIERLNKLGIMHDDLHTENVLWDSSSQSFFPIDINNIKEKYFSSDINEKIAINTYDQRNWASVLQCIAQKKSVPTSADGGE